MILGVALIACLFGASTTDAVKLGMYNVDPDSITVSGLSSGGAMAMQYHVAFSSEVKGSGVIAGIPYGCARAGLTGANLCMYSPSGTIVANLIRLINDQSAAGNIDSPTNLNGQKVYVFHGTRDTTVNPTNGRQVEQIYEQFGVQVTTEFSIAAVHGFPTDFYGAACGSSSATTQYINNCNYHGAFHTLNAIYNGTLTMPTGSETLTQLLQFEQGEFGGSQTSSMDSTGFIYVPLGCASNTKQCKFHISLHGCSQHRGTIGDIYATKTGYLQVAEKNDIIVIFPQASANIMQGNPNGCWDWWGYLNGNFINKNGAQMRAIHSMVQRAAFCDGNADCFNNPDPTLPTTTTTEPGPTTTRDPSQCQPNEVTFRPFPTDCTFYTMCACGANVLLQCAPGLYFDPSINNCNFMQLVSCQDGVRP
ncbi:uncharacterized protein LOC110846509 [Folsomia candida]|uniref:uncharacterized protein LOC110846509 n=1 Tax=Folsomia candida TaxID=158441 RepID=UPI000B902CDE|nr:uncharacterized protein LOC110846509 [Folsomia candida]